MQYGCRAPALRGRKIPGLSGGLGMAKVSAAGTHLAEARSQSAQGRRVFHGSHRAGLERMLQAGFFDILLSVQHLRVFGMHGLLAGSCMPKTRRRPRREAPLGGHIEDFRKEIRDVLNSCAWTACRISARKFEMCGTPGGYILG